MKRIRKLDHFSFFSHWLAHPLKDGTDVMHRAFNPGMIHSHWRKIREKDISVPNYGILGKKIIYHLIDTQVGLPVGSSGFKIEVYEAPTHFYADIQNRNPNQPLPDLRVKKSPWGLFKLYRYK